MAKLKPLPSAEKLIELEKFHTELTDYEAWLGAQGCGIEEIVVEGVWMIYAARVGPEKKIRLIASNGIEDRPLIGIPWHLKLLIWPKLKPQLKGFTFSSN